MTTTTDRIPLTERQKEILAWIAEFISRNGFSPTVRELCLAFNFASTEGAMCHLRPLRRKGWLDWQDGHARTMRLVEVEA
jgi:repressor LexA